jgi:glycosyltransferase involved in cell wall biosynthesis/CheY-like chemotaxis protein
MSLSSNGITDRYKPSLSFVIPAKDEQETIEPLFRKIADQASRITAIWEIIYVDDGSGDQSWQTIQKLATENAEHVKAIRFRRNVGKAAALAAGWKESRGDLVFTMDADLQDDPEEIPRFVDKMQEGFDVVTGWKQTRHDPWHKVFPSRVFNLLLSHVNGVHLHDHNCGFKCYRREVVQALPMYGEMHRMVPSLAAMHGFLTTEIPVKHHPRRYGRSKYGLQRFLRGFLDMWTVHFLKNFRERPMHLMGGVSILMLGSGCILAFFLARVSLPLSVYLLLSSALPALLVGSVSTVMLGLIAESNVHQSTSNARQRPVAETIGLTALPAVVPINGALPQDGPTALVLEGDSNFRESITTHLRGAGWRVFTAACYEEARPKLRTRLDLVVLAVNVQDNDGTALAEFIRLAREASPSSEIIFLPSEACAPIVLETLPGGKFDCRCKPVEPQELVNVALRAFNQGRKSASATHG